MHNRKKPVVPPSEAEVNAMREKTAMYKSLVQVVLTKKMQKDMSLETLSLVGKLLKLNPDFYSLWNMRREILFFHYPDLVTASPSNKFDLPDIRDVELQVSADGIRKNPKSYGAWHHRLWVADRFIVDFESELELCREFLRQDQRNFHCWNYRRAIHSRSDIPPEHEFQFSTDKIQENFSNYSAFHHRSIYLKETSTDIEELIESESSIVENAIFTEPDDQSAWWYQQFLCTWSLAKYEESAKDLASFAEFLEKQLSVVQALLEIEPGSRWAMNSLVFLLDIAEQVRNKSSTVEISRTSEESVSMRKELLEKLIEVDPNHRNRYSYMLRKLT